MTNHLQVHAIPPRIRYIANGTTIEYEFPFAIFKTSDIDVYFNDKLQEKSTYTVSIIPDKEGGSVIFEIAPINGTIITIIRNLSIERISDFQEGGALRAKVLNDEFDYQTACLQQVADNLNRSMVLPPYATDINVDLTLPTPSAGKAIVWNRDGTNLENSAVKVNELESTLNRYKEISQTASSEAVTAAQTAVQKANIATQKADEAISTVDNKANIDFSNVTQENARKLVGNRIWFSGEYSLSATANVVISHNLGLSDITKALAIPYLKFTNAYAGYEVGEIISNFSICGAWYTPAEVMTAVATYGPFLNLSQNSVVLPKIINNSGVILYNKSSGAISTSNISNFKIFVKILY